MGVSQAAWSCPHHIARATPGSADDAYPAADLLADFDARCEAHRAIVAKKFDALAASGDEDGADVDYSLSDADLKAAEATAKSHLHRIQDTQARFQNLVAHAAVNGLVSKMDAALLEVAWLQTTLDPAKFRLF